MGPVRFRPWMRPLVWGGRRLAETLGKALPTAADYGESWEVSDHPSHRSVALNGPWAGRTLRELMETERSALLGRSAERYPVFPWLVKHLDARDWLSVQVHPDDVQARRHWPGEGGKTEVWFILDAAPDSRVYAGLRPGVDEGRFRRALADGTVVDCLHQFRPRPGDSLFLPAGTIHAVGGGVLMAEVQQTSDATFRLHDWGRVDAQGRPRQLHVEPGLACTDWRRGPVEPVHAPGYPQPGKIASPEPVHRLLARCPFFELTYVRESQPFALAGTGRLQTLIVAHGAGEVGSERLTAGDTLVLPASLPAVSCRPQGPLGLLVATLPE